MAEMREAAALGTLKYAAQNDRLWNVLAIQADTSSVSIARALCIRIVTDWVSACQVAPKSDGQVAAMLVASPVDRTQRCARIHANC